MAKPHEQWIEVMARCGYLAKGLIYGIIGFLAILAALDLGGEATGTKGAFQAIARQPLGRIPLFFLTVGLVGYVLWRFIQAIRDPEHDEITITNVLRRLGYGVSGLCYGAVAVSAVRVLMISVPDSGGGKSSQGWAAQIMTQPFGRWLVGAGGICVIAFGCYYLYRAIKAKFRKHLKLKQMADWEKIWATRLGRFGLASRGVVYVLLGSFIMQAAIAFDPSKVETSEGLLESLNDNPTDEWLLSIIAVGFMAYAVHMIFQFRYRSIDPL